MLRWLLLVGLLAAPLPAAAQETVYRIPVTGVIENGLAPYIARALREAAEAKAVAVVLDLDTPGGRVDAAERIVDAIRASAVPVYAFVNPRAYSAGAMIALATKGIYMNPAGVMGAATPVDGSGTKAPEKMVSALRAEFRALAEANGLEHTAPQGAPAVVEQPGARIPRGGGHSLRAVAAGRRAPGQAVRPGARARRVAATADARVLAG